MPGTSENLKCFKYLAHARPMVHRKCVNEKVFHTRLCVNEDRIKGLYSIVGNKSF